MASASPDLRLDPHSRARLNRALWLARAVMLWEQGAGIWTPLVLAAGLIATAGLWGLFEALPFFVHASLVTLVLFVALAFAAWGGRRLRWPTREEVRDRLEMDSRLVHAPLSSLEDAPAVGDAALWELHQAQARDAAARARVGRPKAGMAGADPYALRFVLVLAAVLALWVRGAERAAPEAGRAFRPVGVAAQVTGEVLGNGWAHAVALVTGGKRSTPGGLRVQGRTGTKSPPR